jgi:hypothetical protein
MHLAKQMPGRLGILHALRNQCTLGESPAASLDLHMDLQNVTNFLPGIIRVFLGVRLMAACNPTQRIRPTRRITSADGQTSEGTVTKLSSGLTATPQKNIKIKKWLTTFTVIVALMTGSVAQLAVLLYRGARIIVVSSVSFAGENGLVAWREQDRVQQQTTKNAMP